MAEIELQGMQELLDQLTALGRRGARIENKALLAAAKPILDEAVMNAPIRTGGGAAGLAISRVKTKGDEKHVLIGIEKADMSEIFYMKFIEFGSSPHRIIRNGVGRDHPGTNAEPFLGPAYESKKGEAISILKEEFRKGLGL
jgi:HK97 gp10 family phage protein